MTLDEMHDRVVLTLVDMERMFVKGMKLTFIARHPDNPEMDILITKDREEELQLLLERSKSRKRW